MEEDLFITAMKALSGGIKRVEFTWKEVDVVAYWVKDLLRVDIKGLKK